MLIWNINKKDSESKEKKPYYDKLQLTADPNVYGEVLATQFYNKMICGYAAGGNYEVFKEFYYEEPPSKAWEYLTIKKVINY